MGKRSGQATLMGVLLLGIAMAVFTWIASGSLEGRKKDSARLVQKLAIKAHERRLDQAFRSPNFIQENFLNFNTAPTRDGTLRDFVKAQIMLQTLQEQDMRNMRVMDLRAKDEAERTLFGGDIERLGKKKRHRLPDFSPCGKDETDEACPITSQVNGTLRTQDGVGYIDLVISFESPSLRVNPLNPENQINVTFPVNIFGVQIEGQKIFCKRGYKVLLITQSPGDFLCMLDE